MRKILLASLLLFLGAAASAASADDFSYLFTRDGNTIISGNMDVGRILSLNDRLTAPYIWAHMNGRQYLIRDAGTFAEASAAFLPGDALDREEERLEERMDPLESREEELEREIDRLQDDLGDREDLADAERRRMEKRLEELERLMEPVTRQLRTLEAEEERLDQRQEQVEKVAEKKLRGIIERAVERGLAQRVR